MSEFESLRRQLLASRESLHAAQDAVTRARQKTLRLETEYAKAQRAGTPRRPATLDTLRKQVETARAEEKAHRDRLKELETNAADIAGRYGKTVDPTKAIEAWSDAYPILLFPVRLEARFRRIESAPAPRDELWVRIYPDDCSIDTFEAELSDTELKSAERYWTEWWESGGDEAQRRTAWRNLVASHGPGRATWITRTYAPVNTGDEPTKVRPQDIVLVILSAPPATQAERDAQAVYWTAVWRAASNTAQLNAALTTLNGLGFVPGASPKNFEIKPSPPDTRAAVTVTVAWLQLPDPTAISVKSRSWTTVPTARALPDAFVVIGYQNGRVVFEAQGKPVPARLVAGPDPSATPAEQIQHDADGELVIPEAMRWMVDFDAAIDVGLGLKIPLDPERVDLNAPIDRVLALGVRLSEDEDEGRKTLEELLTHHRFGRSGFAFVPQGSPTNNTESEGTAYSRAEDADAAYEANKAAAATVPPAVPPPAADWWNRSDGRWFADLLGIDDTVLSGVPHASRKDFTESRALNRALWPATFGYAMETMLHPVFTAEQIESTRWFFSRFVTGRGLLPVLRIDDQPYGVLPISAIARVKWPKTLRPEGLSTLEPPENLAPFIAGLASVLATMRADWATFSQSVARIGQSGDPHQMLLDIVGLHPASVELHQRYAEGLEHLFNKVKFQGIAGLIAEHIRVGTLTAEAMQLLRRLGYMGEAKPDALEKFFFSKSQRLNGAVIDDRPLSETAPVRGYTEDDRNYLAWLLDTAQTSFEDLRLERGFKNDAAPNALLYVMLRHAIMLGYWDTSLKLFEAAGAIEPAALANARRESAFVHVAAGDGESESRFKYLYSTDARVSTEPGVLVADHIRASIGQARAADLTDQLDALALLIKTPTARLERCLAEHIDVASYRLDAWLLGLVHYQLAWMRYGLGPHEPPREPHEPRRGVFLGAYGVLENLRRKPAALPKFEPPDRLIRMLAPKEPRPLLRDPTNGGYIFAPSLNQATTAAVLRAGYLANATPQTPSPLALNLSSRRVRIALNLIEGIRTGQPLGALLGYQLQRGLHEGHGALELDHFINPLRKAFPLVADQMASTLSNPTDPIESLEANNVVDGLKLIEHIRKTDNSSYPFGLPRPPAPPRPDDPPMPDANDAERAAIDIEVDRLLDAHDALADLALAEGVHQAVLGNYDGVAATLDAFSKGTFPPEPNVVRTPRSGIGLTHRVGLHFETGLDHTASPVGGIPVSPRSMAQPMLNKWLVSILPPPDQVGCLVQWLDPGTGVAQQEIVTQLSLKLQPIDLVHIATLDDASAMGELDDRIVEFILTKHTPRSDVVIDIRHTARLADPLKTFFEVAPLVRVLRTLLLRSRPLVPTDVTLAVEAKKGDDATQTLQRDAVQDMRDELDQLRTDLAAVTPAPPVDTAIDTLVGLFGRAARFGIQQVGWGFVYEWRRQRFADVITRVQGVIDRWTDRLARFDSGLIEYGNLPATTGDYDRFTKLGRIDLLVSAATLDPRPATPVAYRAALPARRTAMNNKRTALQAIFTTQDHRIVPLVNAVKAALPFSALDDAPFSIDAIEHDLTVFIVDVKGRVAALRKELDKRIAAADAALQAHDATSDPLARVSALQEAGSAMLGEEVRLIPEFSFNADRAAELANAHAASTSGALTQFLRTQRGVDFPVDDFLHGIARVREKLHAWEQTATLAATFGRPEPALTPLQLPHKAGEGWLALEFDPAQTIDGERLLYTAHYAAATNPAGPTCGLLLDEWSEVIPARDETAGVAVHFDRPSSEPPQTWFLVAPAQVDGKWQWADVVDAIDEALALARLRAVEPAHVDASTYARFLPATTSAATLYGISISANFSRVNQFAAQIGTTDG